MFQIKAILNVFNVFGVPPALDETAQRQLLQEVVPLFTEEDNKMLDAQPTKEETKEIPKFTHSFLIVTMCCVS